MIEAHAEEIEVLQSIYPDEFELLSPADAANPLVKLNLKPTEGEAFVAVTLTCEMVIGYPEEIVPVISISVVRGLSAVHAEELMELALQTAEDNVGMPSIFTISEAVKEWLMDNNVAGQDGSMYSEMIRKEQQKTMDNKKTKERAANKAAADSEAKDSQVDEVELERIRKRQQGTQCTVESFMAWKKSFDEEMRLKRLAARNGVEDEASSAPTGKQFFLHKVGAGTGDEDEDEEEKLISTGENEDVKEEDYDDEDDDDEDYVEGQEDDDDDDDDDEDDDDDDYEES